MDDGIKGRLNANQIAEIKQQFGRSLAEDLISIKEVAAKLGVSVRTIRRWQAKGGAPPRRRYRGKLMYWKQDIDAWLAPTRTPKGHLREAGQ